MKRIFIVGVCCGDEAYSLAEQLVAESGARSYTSEDEFPDGVQDPIGAVDEADAVLWLAGPGQSTGLSLIDYNFLYADTVFLRAVSSGKPVLYYYYKPEGVVDDRPSPTAHKLSTRRYTVRSLLKLEDRIRHDLQDIVSGAISCARRPSIFLSHTKVDKPFARQLGADLGKAGVRVWLDEAEIRVGDSLIEKIRQGIDEMDYFAVVLSPESVGSEWVRREVDVAMNQEIGRRKVKVLPLLYRSCELPGFLAGKLYADFSADYKLGLEQILRRLEPHV